MLSLRKDRKQVHLAILRGVSCPFGGAQHHGHRLLCHTDLWETFEPGREWIIRNDLLAVREG